MPRTKLTLYLFPTFGADGALRKTLLGVGEQEHDKLRTRFL